MNVHLLACSIFQPELEQVLNQIKDERLFDCEISITYLDARLHVNFDRLMEAVLNALDLIASDRVVLLYGAHCHPRFDELLKGRSLVRFPQANCIEMILGERMQKIERASRTFFLTTGWLLRWRDLLDPGWGTRKAVIRRGFGYYIEKTLYIDTGICAIANERLLDFFDHTQVPITIEKIGLATFKDNIVAAIKQAAESRTVKA